MISTGIGPQKFLQLAEAVPHVLLQLGPDRRTYTPPPWVFHAVFESWHCAYQVDHDDPLDLFQQHENGPATFHGQLLSSVYPPKAAERLITARQLASKTDLGTLARTEPLAYIDLVLAGEADTHDRLALENPDPSLSISGQEERDFAGLYDLIGIDFWSLPYNDTYKSISPEHDSLVKVLPRIVDGMSREHDLRVRAVRMLKSDGLYQFLTHTLYLISLYFLPITHPTSVHRTNSLYLLRFLRNAVVAGGVGIQARVLNLLLKVDSRALLRLTSGAIVENPHELPLARAFVQVLANCTTKCKLAQERFWDLMYPSPPSTDKLVSPLGPSFLQRLVEMNDPKIAIAVRVLLLNCVRESPERAASLTCHPDAHPIVRMILHGAHRAHELLISSEENKGEEPNPEQEELLLLDYALFCAVFREGLLGSIVGWLATSDDDQFRLSTELVTLLKFFDAYIDGGAENYDPRTSSLPATGQVLKPEHDVSALWAVWTGLAQAMLDILSLPPDPTEAEKKSEMVALHSALVLILQVVCAFILPTQGQSASSVPKKDEQRLYPAGQWLVAQFSEPNHAEGVVSLLQAIEKFAPPVSPFPTRSTGASPLPEGHVLSHTGSNTSTHPQGTQLPYLKRDLLRLLTALTFLPPTPSVDEANRVKDVQDRARAQGGLWTVLNMTQLDVANPYIREHAILALAFLLKHNPEAQADVAQLQPHSPPTPTPGAMTPEQVRQLDQARHMALERARGA